MVGDANSPGMPVVFYRSAMGNEPVREWLRELGTDDRRSIGLDLMRLHTGWPIGMPLCRSLGRGLWEVRSSLPSRRIARLLIVIGRSRIYVLHGFIKKSQATPATDLDLARTRMREIEP